MYVFGCVVTVTRTTAQGYLDTRFYWEEIALMSLRDIEFSLFIYSTVRCPLPLSECRRPNKTLPTYLPTYSEKLPPSERSLGAAVMKSVGSRDATWMEELELEIPSKLASNRSGWSLVSASHDGIRDSSMLPCVPEPSQPAHILYYRVYIITYID